MPESSSRKSIPGIWVTNGRILHIISFEAILTFSITAYPGMAYINEKPDKHYPGSTLSNMRNISESLVEQIDINHTEHIEAREKQLESVLQVMVSTIDARDPVTSGHSARVARYAVGICEELGLDRDYREKIRIAALLHDYGKIGVPDSLLKNKERFTAHEMENIKCHAEKTVKMLEQMGFEGYLADVPFTAGSHHEKLDGSGYPNGLKGREIPLGARIIAVADYFEALTASRYYKRALAPEKAIGMLIRNSGTHFDAKIVEAFIRHYHGASEAVPAAGDAMAAEKKIRQAM